MHAATGAAPMEVLLIEDNPGDVDLTLDAMNRGNLTIHATVARDGAQALALLERQGAYCDVPPPDLILLDLNLPKNSGEEILTQIKSHREWRRIPVAVLTSSQCEKDIVKCYELHANCFVTKPLDLADLRHVIDAITSFWFTIAKLCPRRA